PPGKVSGNASIERSAPADRGGQGRPRQISVPAFGPPGPTGPWRGSRPPARAAGGPTASGQTRGERGTLEGTSSAAGRISNRGINARRSDLRRRDRRRARGAGRLGANSAQEPS